MDYTTQIVYLYFAAVYGGRGYDGIMKGLTDLLVLGGQPDIKPMHRKMISEVTYRLEVELGKCY